MKLKPLNPEEKRVIEDKATEAPHSGRYDNFFDPGIYVCRRCGAPLYLSENKFEAHCGWPSFDLEIPGAVRRNPDADGKRTEIACERCGAHLGHVFLGERLTPKNTRHCVNSLSMLFLTEKDWGERIETAYFGGGCFWCVEAWFSRIKGVNSAVSGYAGGKTPDPDYGQVSGGKTGHAEVVKVEYDPKKISFEALLGVFFALHDPTTPNRQGADTGTQYRSVILFSENWQGKVAKNFLRKLKDDKIFENPIVTEIKPLEKFYEAEEYHQKYFEKNPEKAYCQTVISPKISKLRRKFASLLKTTPE